jgi:hypothetical protein
MVVGVGAPSAYIRAPEAGDPSNKVPLSVSFSTWVSRGRRASITVASMIGPPIASQPFAFSSASFLTPSSRLSRSQRARDLTTVKTLALRGSA